MQEHENTIIPHLTIRNAAAAIEYYKNSLGFKVLEKNHTPDGRIMHCMMRRGDAHIMLNDEFPEISGHTKAPQGISASPVTLHLTVPDIDKEFAKAIRAGGRVTMPVADMFWGDRYGRFTDPFGHQWSMSTHIGKPSPTKRKKTMDKIFKKRGKKK
jgi:PhnB protein